MNGNPHEITQEVSNWSEEDSEREGERETLAQWHGNG